MHFVSIQSSLATDLTRSISRIREAEGTSLQKSFPSHRLNQNIKNPVIFGTQLLSIHLSSFWRFSYFSLCATQ